MASLSVYVVDDQTFIVEVVKAALTTAGHTVRGSTSGVQAERDILDMKPDFALIDILMEDVDGIELCRRLRAHRDLDGTRILMVTGTAYHETAIPAKKAGADGFVAKPIERDRLLQQIELMARTPRSA